MPRIHLGGLLLAMACTPTPQRDDDPVDTDTVDIDPGNDDTDTLADPFDWTAYQVRLSAFHAEAAPQPDRTNLALLVSLCEDVVEQIDALGEEEGRLAAAQELLSGPHGLDGEAAFDAALVGLGTVFGDADGTLAWASLVPAHFTVELMDRTLPDDVVRDLEEAFGTDLSDVRARVRAAVEDAADTLGSEAFAPGHAPYFQGVPHVGEVAHEAAHVVQQRAGAATQATGEDPEVKKQLDAQQELKKKLKDAQKRLKEAYDAYGKLLEASRKGELDSSGRAKADLIDVIEAANEVLDLLDEVNELLEALGEDPMELEDLDEESF